MNFSKDFWTSSMISRFRARFQDFKEDFGNMNSLDWSGGMDYWSGVLDWTTGVGGATFNSCA